MRLKTAIVCLLFSFCPCALCYGQFGFSSVNGEGGYSAMRGTYRWEADNGLVLTPNFGYFRLFDNEENSSSFSRFGVNVSYDLNDVWSLQTGGFLQPHSEHEQAFGYYAGAVWFPFYYWNEIKQPFVRGRIQQTRYRTSLFTSNNANNIDGIDLFKEVETGTELETGFDLANWKLKAQWNKVLKYNNKIPQFVSFSWAEVPYLTAVIQGFIREAYAIRLYYSTDFIAPYATWVQYRYVTSAAWAQAVQGGLRITLWGTSLIGGVEIFEPSHEDTRKLFFMFSMEAAF